MNEARRTQPGYTHLVSVKLLERDVDLAYELRMKADGLANGDSATGTDVSVVVLDEGQELGDKGVRNIKAIVLPDAVGKAGILRILVMDGNPHLARVIKVGQVKRLESLERGVADDNFLRKRALKQGLDFVKRRVDFNGLAKVDESRGG